MLKSAINPTSYGSTSDNIQSVNLGHKWAWALENHANKAIMPGWAWIGMVKPRLARRLRSAGRMGMGDMGTTPAPGAFDESLLRTTAKQKGL